ncbi:MAG: acetyl-CoA carboxylase biotin carboxyl carrier protein [Chroococcidiopsidaceae cyanobacterium CP_BM_ER_R8_30]|nr:acetyl-CoA carboxylase biotin carboxyl carrier protein [Chroococcidiopsidaceae cyanobacterium CP_BM_ER_R8_30]
MPFDFDEIRQLLIVIAETNITEVTLKNDNFELTVRKGLGGSSQTLPTVEPKLGSGMNAESPPVVAPAVQTVGDKETVISRIVDTTMTAAVQYPAATPVPTGSGLTEVISPMVGTFYRAPAPGEPSFVEIGDRIRLGQTVCIIEAMKLMNEIESEVAGQVIEILLQNGEPVEFGQPLMRVRPD